MYQLRMLCGTDAETTGLMTMSGDMLRAMKGSGKSPDSVSEEKADKPESKRKGRRRRRRRK